MLVFVEQLESRAEVCVMLMLFIMQIYQDAIFWLTTQASAQLSWEQMVRNRPWGFAIVMATSSTTMHLHQGRLARSCLYAED